MKDIVIIGAGGFGKEVAWLIEQINRVNQTWNLLGYVDDNKPVGTEINGTPILGPIDWLKDQKLSMVCSISQPTIRHQIVEALINTQNEFVTLIHPKIEFSDSVTIGAGSLICEGAKFTVNISIGNHVIIYHDSIICHDTIINDYCTILPSVNISGNVHIDHMTTLGTGSKVIQNLKIGSNVMIGAGSVVIRDIGDNLTAVGVPAKTL
jgi:sugar O-acyltransferase (sialic acid O-acetyltransferase NeuD family)